MTIFTAADPRTPTDIAAAHPKVRVSATASWLDAEPRDGS